MNHTSNRSGHNSPYSARVVTHAQFPNQPHSGTHSRTRAANAGLRTDNDRLRETVVALDERTLRDVIARQGEILRHLQSSEPIDQFAEDDDDEVDIPMAREAVLYQIDPEASQKAEAESGDACALIIFIIGFVVFLAWFANLFMLCKETTKRGKVCASRMLCGTIGPSVTYFRCFVVWCV
eukprot:INCI6246.3.p1 GENE.INCI6246.3~~INCI6246.3.p1  ORF type:complete len:180 (+),score=23.06 INCI6246.3:298-837(+)